MTSLGTIEYSDLPHRPNRTSLGYEPSDVRLCRLGQFLITALISADLRREVDPVLPRLPVSSCPAASGLQIVLQNRPMT